MLLACCPWAVCSWIRVLACVLDACSRVATRLAESLAFASTTVRREAWLACTVSALAIRAARSPTAWPIEV
ncbi:hypothetical protein D3C81_555020 [compost metagenome]